MVRAIFAIQESMHEVERQKVSAEVEVSTITAAGGDWSIGARNHDFKSQTFKIPTNCDLCGDRIWGLSAKGFDCIDCGYTCHSKCELKVPADCPGEQTKEQRHETREPNTINGRLGQRVNAVQVPRKGQATVPGERKDLAGACCSLITRFSNSEKSMRTAMIRTMSAPIRNLR